MSVQSFTPDHKILEMKNASNVKKKFIRTVLEKQNKAVSKIRNKEKNKEKQIQNSSDSGLLTVVIFLYGSLVDCRLDFN